MPGKIIALVAVCGLMAACAERLMPESENIRVLDTPEAAENCHRFASALIQNKNPLFKKETQSEQLLIKAKNLAQELGADTVVPMPATFKDRQSFRFYMCDQGDHGDG